MANEASPLRDLAAVPLTRAPVKHHKSRFEILQEKLSLSSESRHIHPSLSRLPRLNHLLWQRHCSQLRRYFSGALLAFSVCHFCDAVVDDRDDNPIKTDDAAWLLILSCLCFFSNFYQGKTMMEGSAKTTEGLLELLFAGFPPNSVMVSYSWATPTHPRKVPALIPRKCWLDVLSLFPGDDTKTACTQAAHNASLRLVFLSQAYLDSPICQAELEVCKQFPSTTVFFVDPTMPKSGEVARLRGASHIVVDLPPKLKNFSAAYLLSVLCEHGVLRKLFATHSPPINEDWEATALALVGERTWTAIGVTLIPLLFVLFNNLAVMGYAALSFSNRSGVLVAQVIFFACATIIATFASMPNLVRFGTFKPTIEALEFFKHSRMPDLGWVLVVLSRIGVVPDPVFFHATQEVMERNDHELRLLAQLNVLRLVSLPRARETRGVLCLSLDGDGRGFRKSPALSRTLYYTTTPIKDLLPELSPDMRNRLIAGGIPDLEAILLVVLNATMKSESLTAGSNGFHLHRHLAETNASPRLASRVARRLRRYKAVAQAGLVMVGAFLVLAGYVLIFRN